MNILDCGSDHWDSESEDRNANAPRAHYAYTIDSDDDERNDHSHQVSNPTPPVTQMAVSDSVQDSPAIPHPAIARTTRPFFQRDFASSFRGIPIAGEYDNDYEDDSWDSSDDEDTPPPHLPCHDGDVDMQLDASNHILRKLSKGQRQRQNRSLKKARMAREKADLNALFAISYPNRFPLNLTSPLPRPTLI
jgi:hypothetical protein